MLLPTPCHHATADSTSRYSSEVLEHAILDGGETPVLPPSSRRAPAHGAAGALRQPDFGMQDASSAGQGNTGSAAGDLPAKKAGRIWYCNATRDKG